VLLTFAWRYGPSGSPEGLAEPETSPLFASMHGRAALSMRVNKTDCNDARCLAVLGEPVFKSHGAHPRIVPLRGCPAPDHTDAA
jgi:hypothetical protein